MSSAFNSIILDCLLIAAAVYQVVPLQPIPRVRRSGETIAVAAGQTLQLECVVENVPRKLKVKWERCKRMRDDGACESYSGISSRNKVKYDRYFGIQQEGTESYILTIYNMKPTQSGTYYCSVKTALLAKRTYDFLHVIVYQVPVINFLATTPDTVMLEGSPVHLNCQASGHPQPVVHWERAGGSKLHSGSPKLMNTSLILPTCDQELKGVYMCVATNTYGKTVHTITLDCLGSPKILATPARLYQKVGYQVKLSCTAFSSPEVTRIWWTRNGKDILEDNHRYSVCKMKAALGRVITRLVLKDGVEYTDYNSTFSCHARNALGVANSTLTILESDVPTAVGGRILPAVSSSGVVNSLPCITLLKVLTTAFFLLMCSND